MIHVKLIRYAILVIYDIIYDIFYWFYNGAMNKYLDNISMFEWLFNFFDYLIK